MRAGLLLLLFAAGCRIALPPALDSAVLVKPTDASLRAAMGGCLAALNRHRGEAESAAKLRDLGVLSAGGVAAVSSALSAALPSDSAGKTAAAVAASAAGFVGLLFQLKGSPTFPLEKHSRASRHWDAALSVVEPRPGLRADVHQALYAYAMAQFRECQSDMPSGKPPPPPIQPYLLSIDRVGPGRVVSFPGGIDCGEVCSAVYDEGRAITLRAVPGRTSTFTGWTGACEGTQGPICSLELDRPRKVGARFAARALTLRVARAGTGAGTVLSSPGGIDCGEVCAFEYEAGTEVTLRARAAEHSELFRWSGCAPNGDVCKVTVNDNLVVTATFGRRRYTVAVSRGGEGVVRAKGAGIECGVACVTRVDAGTMLTLEAEAPPGWRLAEWTGACAGNAPTCAVRVDADKTVGARFVRQNLLTVSRTGNGSVWSRPPGIRCGPECTGAFDLDAEVTLEAVPDLGSRFAGWGGACAGSAPACVLRLDVNRQVSATFTPLPRLSVTRSGEGTVRSTPKGIDCGPTCTAPFEPGARVTLEAAPAPGWRFTGWSGACSGASPSCEVRIERDVAASARFARGN
jgi:hypothetical protein